MSALKKFGAKDICVAGGAIRDTLLGKPVKDIDVFYTGTIYLDDTSELAKHYGMKWDTDEDEVDTVTYKDSNIEVTPTNLLFQDIPYPVQLIGVKGESLEHIMDLIAGFPCGLSKVCLTQEGGLCVWPEFLQNEFFKIVSYTPETPAKYKAKIQKKYPEYTHE